MRFRTALAIVIFCGTAQAQVDVVARARQLATEGHRAEAIALLDQRLAATPDDLDARTLLGIVLSWDHQYARARTELRQVLLRDPDNADAKAALENVERWSASESRRSEWMIGWNYDDFGDSDPWREVFTTLKAGPARMPFVLREAHARRFSENDNQFELEAYPKFGAATYAYLAAGLSSEGDLYPRSRFGAELFHTFTGGWEVSAGGRRLNFAHRVNVYTASVGKYMGNWVVSGRAFKTTDTTSAQLVARRYFGAPGQYVGLRAGRGVVRDDIRSSADVSALEVREIAAEALLVIRNRWLINGRAGAGRARRGSADTASGLLAFGVRF